MIKKNKFDFDKKTKNKINIAMAEALIRSLYKDNKISKKELKTALKKAEKLKEK